MDGIEMLYSSSSLRRRMKMGLDFLTCVMFGGYSRMYSRAFRSFINPHHTLLLTIPYCVHSDVDDACTYRIIQIRH